jgi:hypothetical protein
MKNRHEDDLIRLAFGDLEAHEAEAVRARVAEDPAAKRLYATYSGMAEGLKDLKAPEHQLSTERLRHVILNKGLENKSPAFLRWIWAPTALAAIVVTGWFLARSQTDLSAKISPQPSNNERVLPGTPDPEDSRAALGTISPTILNPNASTETQPDHVASITRPKRFATNAPVDRESERRGMRTVAMLKSAEPGLEIIEAAVADAAVENDGSSGIVIIGAETDAHTGARKATEVPSPSNVVIGG